jgi:hypothetical protein
VDVLKLWIRYDMDNIFRIKCGILHFRAPYEFETNSADVTNGESGFGGPFSEQSLQRAEAVLKELLGHITKHHYDKNKLVGATIYAMALRRLSPDYQPGEITPRALHAKLNELFGMSPPTYAYQAVDELLNMLSEKLAQHGISDTG